MGKSLIKKTNEIKHYKDIRLLQAQLLMIYITAHIYNLSIACFMLNKFYKLFTTLHVEYVVD